MFVAQQLGRYHLMDRVAYGGMAEIYRAKTFDSHGNQHVVAIKRVLRHLAEDDDFLQMLVDEAKIATSLDHPNIAKVYEFARCGDQFFIAMEFVDGKDLRSILDRCRLEGVWIPPEDCAYVMIRVLDALHAAHETRDGAGSPLNIVHRDVSPSNVIVSYQGQVKLCDFGIAKAKMTRVQTRTGVIKGKVRYMSPEQALGRPLDRRTDVFSAGSVLYELLTKQCLFNAENEMELIFRVREAKYQRPTKFNPAITPSLERALRGALARSRSGRYQTAKEFADALRGYLQEAAPDYRPGRLGRLLRQVFAQDIDDELRRLEDFEIGTANPEDLGKNLLAEVLGEGAPYTKFTPVDPRVLDQDGRTRIHPRVPEPERRLPGDVDLHDMKTAIIDREERDNRIIKRRSRPRPGSSHDSERQRLTQMGTIQIPASTADRRGSGLSSRPDLSGALSGVELHSAPTRILASPAKQPPAAPAGAPAALAPPPAAPPPTRPTSPPAARPPATAARSSSADTDETKPGPAMVDRTDPEPMTLPDRPPHRRASDTTTPRGDPPLFDDSPLLEPLLSPHPGLGATDVGDLGDATQVTDGPPGDDDDGPTAELEQRGEGGSGENTDTDETVVDGVRPTDSR